MNSISLTKIYNCKNAIILAAGYGIRMVPLNHELPKGLVYVDGEILIERLIKQLQAVGIFKITIIVGHLKEQYEYLIEKYGVELVENNEFIIKNNLHSLSIVKEQIENTYILPCDIWCSKNPFSKYEIDSWYMVTDDIKKDTYVKVDKNNELLKIQEFEYGNSMVGISYITSDIKDKFIKRLSELDNDEKYNNCFWEEALFENEKMILRANIVDSKSVNEINTYEDLRRIDSKSQSLDNEILNLISQILNVNQTEIYDIKVLKKGMTNRSFIFSCKNKKYIMRIPGEGTDKLINRENEAKVYQMVDHYNISDKLVYINPSNGYKITEYIENSRNCNPKDIRDVKVCINALRNFHNLGLKLPHKFDLFEQIEYYEKLRHGRESVFEDYNAVKSNIYELKKYIDLQPKKYTLTHIDAIPDNFLFNDNEVKIIDWEYASMQDPHVDIAMFAIYSYYNKSEVDTLIDLYFENKCDENTKLKIYCYIAVCGLLWSNWCEYKLALGVEFGDYLSVQYNYAKTYYNIVKKEIFEFVKN